MVMAWVNISKYRRREKRWHSDDRSGAGGGLGCASAMAIGSRSARMTDRSIWFSFLLLMVGSPHLQFWSVGVDLRALCKGCGWISVCLG